MATILIVDDLSTNRKFLATLLAGEGHRLIEATNGCEGLAAVRAEHPDLVITDVLMPVMDGYELVRQIRLDPTIHRTPVLFYTAPYGEHEARVVASSNGGADVLRKPARPEDVFKIVRRMLAGESAPSPAADDDFPISADAYREHLHLFAGTSSGTASDLRIANARLRALINIGLELADKRDTLGLLESVCAAAHDLFGATYVTLGIVTEDGEAVQRFVCCGATACEEPARGCIQAGDAIPGILRAVVIERRVIRGENPGGDPAGLQLPPHHLEVQAFLAAPIASPSRVYGWILLVGNEGRTFSDTDEHLLGALSGQLGRIYEIEREISSRQEAQLALEFERNRARQYLDTAEVVLIALDLDARVILVNRKGREVLGWSEHDLLGRDWVDTCLPARIRAEFRQKFQLLVSGTVVTEENPVLTKSGSERIIAWSNTLLHDADGCITGTLSSGTDVTARNQAVGLVRTAEERMRFALEAAEVGIWDMNFVTGVLQWSEILEAQNGLPPGTFGGTREAFLACVHPEDRAGLIETSRAAESGTDFTETHRSVWPDGTVRWLSGTGRVHLDEHGKPARAVGISLDITERRTLEEQFQQAQKMEAIGRLAGGIAHDFNNLLTAILGYCELLLADFNFDDPRHADITEIQKAGLSASRLTRQLLAFSRKQIIEPTRLDLNALLTSMQPMLGRLIGEDVTITLVPGSALGPVMADRGQMEQVVLNLSVNARDAMPRGGALTIQTANVEIDEQYGRMHLQATPGSYVMLTVSDTGTGMTPEVKARLFEPFFTTKPVGEGTGLGLATIQGIVKQSGGNINVYSEVGKGSAISVYFPRADGPETAVAAPHATAAWPHAGGETILVVEDAGGLRELVRRLLVRHGYRTLLASTAEEAHVLFRENPSIDLLLTDVVMPGASGPELSKELIAERPALKVVYMSGYTEKTIVHHGVVEPGIAFLHKPFTSEALERKVREVLDRN